MRNNHPLSSLNIATSCLLYIKSFFFPVRRAMRRKPPEGKLQCLELVLFAARVAFISPISYSVYVCSLVDKRGPAFCRVALSLKFLNWYWSFIASGSHSSYFRLSCRLRTRVKAISGLKGKKKGSLACLGPTPSPPSLAAESPYSHKQSHYKAT